MPLTRSNGIELAYEIDGPDAGAPLLLIQGLGTQLIRWPKPLVDMFAAAGFRVIRFDNRDAGLSTHLHGVPVPDLATVAAAKQRGETPDIPYSLADLAADTVGLMDALGIAGAHVVGLSFGGMIAQALAIAHPDRVLSLTVMMAQSGNPELPPADPGLLAKLGAPPDPMIDYEAYLRHVVAFNCALAGPDYPADAGTQRALANESYARAFEQAGMGRQLAAARGSPDNREALRKLSLPTLVIHGADDRLMLPACGQDIAHHVRGAWLLIVTGMGHDLPVPLFDLFVGSVKMNSVRSAPGAVPAPVS